MRIPAIFASSTRRGLLASDRWFGPDGRPTPGHCVPFAEAAASLPRTEVRGEVVVVDCDSLSRGGFTEGVVKGMRVRGADIWFMTRIEDADDLFDAFNTVAETVMGPVSAVRSDLDLRDILSVSDSFVPVVEVADGRSSWRGIRPLDAVYRLEDMGFPRVCVLDLDGSVDGHEWERIADGTPSCMAFAKDPSGPEVAGVRTVVSPITLRGPSAGTHGPPRRPRCCPCGRCRGTPSYPATSSRRWPRTP